MPPQRRDVGLYQVDADPGHPQIHQAFDVRTGIAEVGVKDDGRGDPGGHCCDGGGERFPIRIGDAVVRQPGFFDVDQSGAGRLGGFYRRIEQPLGKVLHQPISVGDVVSSSGEGIGGGERDHAWFRDRGHGCRS